jgi:hypothetical protein
MTQSRRKLLGVVALIALLIVYPLAIAIVLGGWLASLPGWGVVLATAVLGGLWFFPAALVVKWMSRPD